MKQSLILSVLILALFSSSPFSEIPRTMSYQGALTDATGKVLVDGNYSITFNLYDDENGLTPVWTEIHPVVELKKGTFSIILGSISSLDIDFDQQYWLGVKIDSNPELTPRIKITSVAYSLNSRSVSDGSITQAKIAFGVTLPPSGTAGGDLTGTYPNPTIAVNAVNTTKLADGSITQAKIATGVTLPPSGSAGGDLSGTYPNPTIAVNAVNTTKLADGSITQVKIAPGVTLPPSGSAGGDLTGTYPNPTVANNAINAIKLANNAVTTTKIADNAVTQAKIASGVILPPSGSAGGDLSGTYPNPTIAVNAVNTTKLADGSITQAKIAPGVTLPPSGSAGGDLTGIYPNPTIAPGVVNSTKLADNAVTTTKIADNAVTQAKLAPDVAMPINGSAGGDLSGTYPNPTIAVNAVNTTKLADSVVTQAKIAPGVTLPPSGSAGGDLTGTYPNPTIANNAINTTKLINNAVTTDKIADSNITETKIASGQVVKGINSLKDDVTLTAGANVSITPGGNTLTISATYSGADRWSLIGNAGTTPSINFLGTTDNNPLELRVNNTRVLRLEPHDFSPNVIGGYSGNNIASEVYGATISGGGEEGYENSVLKVYGTVGGGQHNTAGGGGSTVSGGYLNTASGGGSAVGGGSENMASGYTAIISGGNKNIASGIDATVCGGNGNTASGVGSTACGGYNNEAGGDKSFAAGNKAKVHIAHSGSFLFADTDENEFHSASANEFAIRCTGGARFVTAVDGSSPLIWAQLSAGSGSWADMSDRNVKTDFMPVNRLDILKKLESISIEMWSYKSQPPSIRHIGPMSQDFYAAFGVGDDDKHICTVDANGVALAAIQELYKMLQEKEAENTSLRQRLDSLEARLEKLENERK